MPASLADDAEQFRAGRRRPMAARHAATVVLVRDGDVGLEAYLLRRHAQMAFAAGMYVFPGGVVDPRDADRSVAWAGPGATLWAERFGCDEATARALVCAAVRETFEESGVLLAGADPKTVVADTTSPDWEADRLALIDKSLSFAALLDHRRLVLRADLLGAWAHWITPEFEPRRYDTRFFVAALPTGQRARDVSGEADHAAWMPLAAALAAVDAGDMAMLPPTYVTCRELSAVGNASAALTASAGRRITPVMPRLVADGGVDYLEADLP